MRRTKLQATPILVGRQAADVLVVQRGHRARSGDGQGALAVRSEDTDREGWPGEQLQLPWSARCGYPLTHSNLADGRLFSTACSRRRMTRVSLRSILITRQTLRRSSAPTARSSSIPGMELVWPGEFQITSAPVSSAMSSIVGSAIGDNARVAAPHGTVRAFDVRSGAPKWSWDPVPRDANDPAAEDMGRGVQRRRARQCVGADVGRCEARAGVHADVVGQSRFLRRLAAGRQQARELRRGAEGARRANSCGRFRPCITTFGTTTIRRSRRWRRSMSTASRAMS